MNKIMLLIFILFLLIVAANILSYYELATNSKRQEELARIIVTDSVEVER